MPRVRGLEAHATGKQLPSGGKDKDHYREDGLSS